MESDCSFRRLITLSGLIETWYVGTYGTAYIDVYYYGRCCTMSVFMYLGTDIWNRMVFRAT